MDGGYEMQSTWVPLPLPTAPGAAAAPTTCERGRMVLEEAFLREMTQTDASADATVSYDVQFKV